VLFGQSQEHHVKLIFAAKEGNYFAEISVAIVESQGTKVLDTTWKVSYNALNL
jgi:hypothetical protein